MASKPTYQYDDKLMWQKSSVRLINKLFTPHDIGTGENPDVHFVMPGHVDTKGGVLSASNCTYQMTAPNDKVPAPISLYGETEFLNSLRGTAEHTFALIHAMHRNIIKESDYARDMRWDRRHYAKPRDSLSEMKMLIIGYGALGS